MIEVILLPKNILNELKKFIEKAIILLLSVVAYQVKKRDRH